MESGELMIRPGPSVASKPDGHGGWRAAFYIVVVGFLERIGFYGVQGNLIMYLTGPLGMSTAAAAAGVNVWAGTVQVLPLIGALAADSWLGRFRAVLAAGVLYLLSLGMLTVSSALEASQPLAASSPSSARLAFFYVALYLLALAQGFHRPCIETLGADQFSPSDGDPGARASRSSYFNWFHFSISWGYAASTTAVSYVDDNVGWTVGFGVCWATMVLCLAVFLLGARTYRAEQPVDGSPFVETVSAWAARVFHRKDDSGTEWLLDRKPEEGKGLVVKLLPIWLCGMVYAAVTSQVYTLFTKQASTLDRRLGAATGLVVPPAALQCLVSFTFITMLPVYDRAFVPLARRIAGHHAGVTTLQRIGAGMAMSCVAMVVAALVEARRLRVASDAGLIDRPDVAVPMSLWWVVPQHVLIGLAGVLGDIGLEEFFYDQVPDALRSVGLALSLSAMGAGSYASGMLVSVIDWATRSSGQSWFSDNLNRARLDYFYWLLVGLVALEVTAFLHFAKRFVYRNKTSCDP
ncbi:protein NRT1/ PTR FAMILY 5.16-like [Phragmites australis]|uniref:protein NRT1/ PTR FAMILY 5.16-like n=1 Tax=Phragmites australis TaxID=29695 RepID=UPI002D77EBE3|nr:protein NRT1/ PTR FAMILY 5.16-like [Phragmites australis]